MKGLYVTAWSGGGNINVSIMGDSGNDSPSGGMLASGLIRVNSTGEYLNYVDLNKVINVTANTKYWIVLNGGRGEVQYNYYRSDAHTTSLDYGGTSLHYETSSNGNTWVSPSGTSEGDMVFVLAASDTTINTYNTSQLYNDIVNHLVQPTTAYPDGAWATFQDYLQSQLMYNLTRFAQSYSGRAFVWYTGMPLDIENLVPNINQANVLFSDSGAGGPIGCPPSDAVAVATRLFGLMMQIRRFQICSLRPIHPTGYLGQVLDSPKITEEA